MKRHQIPDGWPEQRDPASLIGAKDRAALLARGLSTDAISDLGEIVMQTKDDQAEHRTPKEVRNAVDRLKNRLDSLREELAKCGETTVGRIEAAAIVPPPNGPGLRTLVISDTKQALHRLDLALAAARRSKTVQSKDKGKADVKRSAARRVRDVMARYGFDEENKAVNKAMDIVLRTAGFNYKPGKRDGEITARQFLKSDKSRLK